MSKVKICGIYKITNPLGRIYIGQSIDIVQRFAKYKLLTGGLKQQTRLYNSLLKHGYQNHTFEILEECSQELLNDRESFYIKKFNSFGNINGLNLTSGGDRCIVSAETKAKISLANKNRSEEVKKKIGLTKIGNKNMLGKKHSAETIAKISQKKTGKKMSDATRKRMSVARRKWKHTDASKDKMSKSAAGKNTWSKGRKMSKQFREKIKASWVIRKLKKAS